jgi:hypothetical protein
LQIWEYLGVGGDSGAAPTITDDQNKLNSNFLRGTIAQGVADLSTGIIFKSISNLFYVEHPGAVQ